MTTLHTTADELSLSSVFYRHGSRWLAHASATVRDWVSRSRGRSVLATMDERMLKDIGLSHADAVAETGKHFWQR